MKLNFYFYSFAFSETERIIFISVFPSSVEEAIKFCLYLILNKNKKRSILNEGASITYDVRIY